MEYLQDIFYKTDRLTKKALLILFQEAKLLSTSWWVDQHNDHGIRKTIQMDLSKVLSLFRKIKRSNLHITFIHRRGYENWDQFLEIGFCTLGYKNKNGGDIFLWIDVDLKHKQYLLQRYFKAVDTI